MLLDVYGTGYFFSLNNSYLSSLFRELGQNTPVEYDYRGLQNRTPLETLFGVKYALCAPDSTGALPALFDRQRKSAAARLRFTPIRRRCPSAIRRKTRSAAKPMTP